MKNGQLATLKGHHLSEMFYKYNLFYVTCSYDDSRSRHTTRGVGDKLNNDHAEWGWSLLVNSSEQQKQINIPWLPEGSCGPCSADNCGKGCLQNWCGAYARGILDEISTVLLQVDLSCATSNSNGERRIIDHVEALDSKWLLHMNCRLVIDTIVEAMARDIPSVLAAWAKLPISWVDSEPGLINQHITTHENLPYTPSRKVPMNTGRV